ncbi:MAG: alpha/beta hydrolase [Dongiaceae bacterium]
MAMLELPDAAIFYEQTGSGPDIVWLAGGDMPGSSWREFQIPAFGDYRNTTYDARGIGGTTSRRAPPWPIPVFAEDCIRLIEAACRPPVFLVGLSLGSLIGQEVCLTRPDLVRAAVLTGTRSRMSGFLHDWESAEIAFRRAGGTLPRDFAIIHYALQMYPSEVLGDDALWARIKPLVSRSYGERDGHELAAQWEACLQYDSLARLPSCRVPLHVVAFSHDVQTPPARGREVAETAPQGHFHLLEGLGHCSAFGHRPDEVNACIRGILAGYRD